MEVLNDVLGYSNLKIYQDSDYFKFSLDGVLLANFVNLKISSKTILDIGTGTGIIPLILSLKTNNKIDAIEIQQELVNLFSKTLVYNNLEQQINVIHGDIAEFSKKENFLNYYDVIVCNPPYFEKNSCIDQKIISRCENFLNLEELFKISKRLLKNNGSLYFVFLSDDISRIFVKLSENNFSIKKLQFVHHNQEKEASLVLVEAIKNGKTKSKVLPPFILYNNDKMTEQYKKIYNGEVITNESEEL